MTRRPASRLLAAALPTTILAGLLLFLAGSSSSPAPRAVGLNVPTPAHAAAMKAGPMAFEPAERGGFITRGTGYSVAIGSRGPTLATGKSAVTMRVEGGRAVAPLASRRQTLVVNRYVGKHARTGIPTFGRVTYRGVLPGIDLRYHGRDGQLEYDFALRPHADPSTITLNVNGARSLRLAPNGDLLMATKDGTLRQHKPVAFQAGKRIPAGFQLNGGRVGFRVGSHDPAKPLLIDPHLSFGDYIGGTGGLDSAQKVAVDSAGDIYIVGTTNSPSIPGGSGSPSTAPDAFVAGLAPDGSRRWVTYLGGNAADQGMDIGLDGSGRPYVVGTTKSTNFPTTAGVSQATLLGNEDGFASALTTSGTLRYSTYNGTGNLDISQGVAVTPSGIAYTAVSTGTTESSGQLVSTTGDVFVLNADGTFGPGKQFPVATGGDSVSAVGLEPGCDSTTCTVYMAGHTVSGGQARGYVFKWNFGAGTAPWGNCCIYNAVDKNGTAINGNQDVAALAIDPNGNPAVIGTAFPTGTNYGFVARYRASDGATEHAGFTFDSAATGGTSNGTDIAFDAQGNMYALAWTSANNGVKTDAVQGSNAGAYDGILLKFAPDAFSTPGPDTGHFVWQTFLGGPSGDYAFGVTTDSHGGTYVVGETGSGGWIANPVTQSKSTGDDGFIWKIRTNAPTIDEGPSGTVASRDATFKYTTGETDGAIECRLLSAASTPAFGSCGTGPSGSHTFSGLADGDYTFEVRTSDSGGTSNGDTTSQAFRVDTTPHASFTIAPNPSLVGRAVSFDASPSTAATAITKYEWDLDGNGSFETDGATAKTIAQVYPSPGTFNVGLRITDSEGHQATAVNALTITTAGGATGQNGVTINNGAQFTNDPDVVVTSTFPSFTTSLLFSNDGGFGKAQTFAAKKETNWKLDSSGPERLPKTIYVRFLTGTFAGETHQDDIILDETPPKVDQAAVTPVAPAASSTSAVASKKKLRTYRVKVKARDSNSGVSKLQITSNKKKPGKALKYKTKLKIKSAKRPKYVRARDRAGNWSKWKTAR